MNSAELYDRIMRMVFMFVRVYVCQLTRDISMDSKVMTSKEKKKKNMACF